MAFSLYLRAFLVIFFFNTTITMRTTGFEEKALLSVWPLWSFVFQNVFN